MLLENLKQYLSDYSVMWLENHNNMCYTMW
jgi:hypothetical protein